MPEDMKVMAKDKNKADASKNIFNKLKALNHLVELGIPWIVDENGEIIYDSKTGRRFMDVCPTSFIQFSRWTLTPRGTKDLLNCPHVRNQLKIKFGCFSSHGQDSLTEDNRPEEHAQAKQLFNAVEKVMKSQLAAENNTDQIKALKNDLQRYKATCMTLASQIAQEIEDKGKVERNLGEYKRSMVEAGKIHQEMLRQRDENIAELEKAVAILKKQIHEIASFVKIAGGKNEEKDI